MKTPAAVLLTVLIAVPVTWLASRSMRQPVPPAANGARKPLYYQSAMHPWIKSDKPGRCTICGMELTPVYEGGSGMDPATGADIVRLSQSMIQVVNVGTTRVETRPLEKTLTVAGMIDENATRHRVLSAYIPGRIQKLYVNFVGAEVQEGEPIAEFYSPALLQAEREYRSLSGDLKGATALRLLQMGLTASQIEELPKKQGDTLTSQILAPMGGTVVSQNIYEGQYVQEGEKLFEIADFSTMWFQFRAYELDLPWIKLGLKVDVTTPSLPGRTVSGVITFIEPNIDEATRSTKVRVELENPLVEGRRLLLYRLYADGLVHLEAPEVLSVARSAVIETGAKAVAYVEDGAGAYSRRVLKLGRRGDALVEVISGLQEGEMVVVNGNLLIDGQAEMNRGITQNTLNLPVQESPELTQSQQKAVTRFLELMDDLGAALASDNLDEFNRRAAALHAAMPGLMDEFVAANKGWYPLLEGIEKSSHLEKASSLEDARKAFYPLSTSAVNLAKGLAKSGNFSSLKVYRCPMTESAFQGAPATAQWIQLQPAVQNPFLGLKMKDCGTEVQ